MLPYARILSVAACAAGSAYLWHWALIDGALQNTPFRTAPIAAPGLVANATVHVTRLPAQATPRRHHPAGARPGLAAGSALRGRAAAGGNLVAATSTRAAPRPAGAIATPSSPRTPAPRPKSAPKPAPKPSPKPIPAPQPNPTPAPRPSAPAPVPIPAPSPAPQPAPQTPAPAPQPAPQTPAPTGAAGQPQAAPPSQSVPARDLASSPDRSQGGKNGDQSGRSDDKKRGGDSEQGDDNKHGNDNKQSQDTKQSQQSCDQTSGDSRPGTGRGDGNHDHTGPPGHSKH